MSAETSPRSQSPWAKGLRPSRALMAEAVRIAVAVFLVATLTFFVFQVWPSTYGAALSLTPHDPKYAGIAAANLAVFQLDQPLFVRYGVWLEDVATGNLGLSFFYHDPVLQVALSSLPATLELVLGSALWALVVGGLLGWIAASPRHPVLGAGLREVGSFLYALPVFFAVLALATWLATSFRFDVARPWMAVSAPQPPPVTGFPVLDSLLSGNLAVAGLAFVSSALLSLPGGLAFAMPVARRTQRLIGGSPARPFPDPAARGPSGRGAVRAALPSLAAALGIVLPFLFGAAMVTEVMTGRRGVGFLMILALQMLDTPLLQGITVVASLAALACALPFVLVGAWSLRTDVRSEEASERGAPPTPPARDPLRTFVGRFPKGARLLAMAGLVLLLVVLGLMALAPVLTPYAPLERVVPLGQACTPAVDCPLSPPSPAHPLGVNFYGEDIFSGVVYGGEYLLGTLGVAVLLAAAVGFGLGLLPSILGRAPDAALRAGLGALAAVPVFVLAFLLTNSAGLGVAVGVLFVPVVFRDVRDLSKGGNVGAGTDAERRSLALRLLGRARAAVASSLPGFFARLPRRAAEMALLVETVTAVGLAPAGFVDWGAEISSALFSSSIVGGSPWAWYLPAMLLILFVLGLLLLSDGLRLALEARPPPRPSDGVRPASFPSEDANP